MTVEWETPPEAHQTGPCPDCGRPRDPRSAKVSVESDHYTGELVVVFYLDEADGRKLAINGTPFGWDEISKARDYALELLGDQSYHAIETVMLELYRSGTDACEKLR